MPAATLSSGDRVQAFIDDRVPAAAFVCDVALHDGPPLRVRRSEPGRRIGRRTGELAEHLQVDGQGLHWERHDDMSRRLGVPPPARAQRGIRPHLVDSFAAVVAGAPAADTSSLLSAITLGWRLWAEFGVAEKAQQFADGRFAPASGVQWKLLLDVVAVPASIAFFDHVARPGCLL